MRAMKFWGAGAVGFCAAFVGCTAGSPAPESPPAATASISPESSAPAAASSAPAPTAAESASSAPLPPPTSEITNDPPPGGTVLTNAGPTVPSDRKQAIMDVIVANRDGFRRCFDIWSVKNPGQDGQISFQLWLKADGALDKAQIKRDVSNVVTPEVESCLIKVAKGLTFPKSENGLETIYTHPFSFKAKK